tara:strand:+ start:8686 stop:9879 length:1194 start_codon:yes stop_codon:yes gene_type:complete
MSKKNTITIILCIISLNIYSQSWKYESGGNAFDGEYKVAYVIGTCSDFPYNKPGLFLNVFKERNLNFYIANSGYYSSENDVEILFVFNNEPNTIYYSNEISLSKDNETIFLSSFSSDNNEFISRNEFIEKLKKSSRLDVRIKSSYKNRDMIFSMSGSSNAINFVITDNYLKHVKNIEEKVRLEIDSISKLEKIKIIKENESIKKLVNILSEFGIEKNEIEKSIKELKFSAITNKYELSDIGRIEVSLGKYAYYPLFSLYDLKNEFIIRLSIDLPNFNTKLKNDKEQEEILKKKQDSLKEVEKEKTLMKSSKEVLDNLIKRYNFPENTNQSILNRFEETYENEKFNLKNIDSTNLILPFNKTNKVLLRIYSKDQWVVSLFDFDLSDDFKKKLKVDKSY